ncbi:hypothetical protein JX266_008046 [Neoarthrinium moseri]|nr:hypothetical protein JX266_008046 [Neoarthrinium moseri]
MVLRHQEESAHERVLKDNIRKDDVFDYIIIGGGTAGVALATRLSQGLPDRSILLIEAGPSAPHELKINVPGMRGSTIGGPFDWNLTTVPQNESARRVLITPRGKILGGSSAFNFMLWNRGSKAEYDGWEELGNTGWNWDSIRESMMSSENFTNLSPDEAGDAGRGTDGPIHAAISRYITKQQRLFISALERLGVPHNVESLNGTPLGVMNHPSSVDSITWARSYSANSYLPLAGSNLQVLLSTQVARVNLKTSYNTNVRAAGITLSDGSVIQASKEVILSSGSLLSPGLLELSGIGKKSVLDAIGVDQVVDLPGVGENLQDHIRISMSYRLKPGYNSSDELLYNATYAAEQLTLWKNRELTVYDGVPNGISLLNWKQVIGDDSGLLGLAEEEFGQSRNPVVQKKLQLVKDDSVAKIELVFLDGYEGLQGYPAPGTPHYGEGYFTIVGAAMHSFNRGSVHVSSPDISRPPEIDPRYLSSEYDIQALIEIGKYVRKVAQTEPLASALITEHEPGATLVSTDEQWREYIINATNSFYHLTSTCSMQPKDDGGVVDPELKVWGTDNLRVVDASVIPVLIASHTQTAVYAIAERAAQLIIEGSQS